MNYKRNMTMNSESGYNSHDIQGGPKK